jgi:ATP-dependent DNA helicase RecQ
MRGEVGHIEPGEHFLGCARVIVGGASNQREAGQREYGIHARHAVAHEETFDCRAIVEARCEGGEDPQLLAELKAARTALARAQNLPPYVIFHDRTLREMARCKPASHEEMLTISGVGEQKMARYGGEFLRVIAEFAGA